MHRRYVIGAYPALLLCGGVCLWQLNGRLVIVVGLLSVVALVVQQETWRVWQNGEVIGWQRGEDWRQAIQYLSQNKQADDVVLLLPNLVETQTRELVKSRPAEYPFFPLDGIYPCHSQRKLLANDEPLKGALTTHGRFWLLARLSEAKMQTLLDPENATLGPNSPSKTRWRIGQHYSFGRVQLVELVPE
jgi:hypothetical protein